MTFPWIGSRAVYFLLSLFWLSWGIISCQKAEAPQPAPVTASAPSVMPPAQPAQSESSGLVKNVTDASFTSDVENSTSPVLVDFWATWCGPCRMFGPIVDKLAEDYRGRLKVVRVDIDQNQGLARNFGIRAIPTALLFKKGKVVKGWVGLVSEDDLKVEVDKVVKKATKKPKASKS